VVEYFKALGQAESVPYQTLMNQFLRYHPTLHDPRLLKLLSRVHKKILDAGTPPIFLVERNNFILKICVLHCD
jgi:hypothetical protein